MKHQNTLNIDGKAKFRLDPDMLGEHYKRQLDYPWMDDARWMRKDLGEKKWSDISIPSCWQVEGYNYNGAAWYRKRFAAPTQAGEGQRVFLRFEGVDYFADVWLNEHYLGSHEGYFAAFQHEISSMLQADNLLVVRVDSPNDVCAKEGQQGQLKGIIKGALQRWDMNDPEVNPGGIWNDVNLIITGAGAITDIKANTAIEKFPPVSDLDEPVPAVVVLEVKLAAFPQDLKKKSARLVAHIRPLNHDGDSVTATIPVQVLGSSGVWNIPIKLEQARLWYTWDLGEPCLYEAQVVLEVDGETSDEASQTFGFREIRAAQGWEIYLNGVRFYQRGANYLSDQMLSTLTEERYRQDVELLQEANLNTVHPFAVVEKQTFYDLCDDHGILVYQDLPIWLAASNSSDLVRRATVQLLELIDQFGHHPSIGIWNFGSQPSVANFEKLCTALTLKARELDPTRIAHQANSIPDYRGVLGRAPHPIDDYGWHVDRIQDFKEKYDWRVDTHQYSGTLGGVLEDLKSIPKEHLELITEYGNFGLPSEEMVREIIPPEALFPPDWSYYKRHNFRADIHIRYLGEPTSLANFIKDSQRYQCQVIQFHTEYYRRLKFAPCNGAHLFVFNDCWPSLTPSVVDYHRDRKPGFFALQRAMSPIQAILEFTEKVQQGKVASTVWIVNDFPRSFDSLVLKWSLKEKDSDKPEGHGQIPCRVGFNTIEAASELSWRFENNCVYIIDLIIEDQGEKIAENRYELDLTKASE